MGVATLLLSKHCAKPSILKLLAPKNVKISNQTHSQIEHEERLRIMSKITMDTLLHKLLSPLIFFEQG